ncbi:hypothetical protein EYR40_007267 [Pleurotus pulmonarius]|nr:hypothetical protein EYR36_003450 [Pleurotus pulmonarius]KAF4600156.1 hypothetical protein EYR40_007267 [Pleurotus pulmonarius]
MAPSPSTSPAASSSATAEIPSANDSRVVVLGVVLGIVAAILVAGIIYMTLRFRRKQSDSPDLSKEDHQSGPSYGTSLSSNHFAARITPFGALGAGGEAPQFAHRPGENMRVAIRRADGGWQFLDQRSPRSPGSFDVHDTPLPSPAPSATSFNTFSSSYPLLPSASTHSLLPIPVSAKEREVQMYAERARGLRQLGVPDTEYAVDEVPPPAYVHDGRDVVRGRPGIGSGSLPPAPH